MTSVEQFSPNYLSPAANKAQSMLVASLTGTIRPSGIEFKLAEHLPPAQAATGFAQVKEEHRLNQKQVQHLQHAPAFRGITDRAIMSLLKEPRLYLIKLLIENKVQWALIGNSLGRGNVVQYSPRSPHHWHIMDRRSIHHAGAKVLAQGIRENLPRAESVSATLNHFRNLLHTGQAVKAGIPMALRAAIHQIQALAPTPHQLTQIAQLKTLLAQTGSFYEYKIAAALQSQNRNPTQIYRSPLALSAERVPRELRHPSPSPTPKILASMTGPKTANSLSSASTNQLKLIAETDFKAQLLTIKQLTSGLLVNADQAKSRVQTIPEVLRAINQEVVKENVEGAQREIIQRIQHHAMSAIAKIQLHQILSLQNTSSQKTSNKSSNSSHQFEFPVRVGDDFHCLGLKIKEDYIDHFDEREAQGKRGRKKIRRWQVSINIELPNKESFYAQITHTQDDTSIKLWAEKLDTLRKTESQLQYLISRLKTAGVNLANVSCQQGCPPDPKSEFQCRLVEERA